MKHEAHHVRWKWYGIAFFLLILLLMMTGIVYYASLGYPFEFDDLSNIVKLFQVRFATFRSLFFANSRWISYWLNSFYYKMLPEGHKFDPYIYRVGNLCIHMIAGTAVYLGTLLLQRTSYAHPFVARAGFLLPLLTAGLFLLHPVQTQTVSYVIQGQLEGVAGAFIFIMLCFFLAALLTQNAILHFLFCALLFLCAALACGSKEIIIVAPVLFLLVDWFFIACGSLDALKQRWWLHGLLLIIILGLYLYLLKPNYFLTILGCSMELQSNIGNMLTESRLEKITSGAFFISQFKVLLHYAAIFFWPFCMSADYDWKLAKDFFAPDAIIPFLVLCGIALYILYRLRHNKTDLISFCVLWFFIALLPRSSIIPSTELLADYKTYVASFGMFLLQALGICALLLWCKERSWWRGGIYTVYAMSILMLMGVGYAASCRNAVWRSAAAFWADVIAHAPNRARAYNNYGVALCELGRNQEAITHFKQAIALDGYYADPYNNLSVAYASLKQFDNAIDAMRKGIRIMPTQPEGYNNLASILINGTGKDDEVELLLKQAIKLRPHYGKAYYNLGKFYLKHQRMQEAWEAFRAACTRADFDNEMGFTTYGTISCTLGKYDDALEAYTHALKINPASVDLALRRIMVLERMGHGAQAQQYLEQLRATGALSPALFVKLGDIWFEQKEYQQALSWYERALAAQPSVGLLYKTATAAEHVGDYVCVRRMLAQLDKARLSPQMKQAVNELKQRMSQLS